MRPRSIYLYILLCYNNVHYKQNIICMFLINHATDCITATCNIMSLWYIYVIIVDNVVIFCRMIGNPCELYNFRLSCYIEILSENQIEM